MAGTGSPAGRAVGRLAGSCRRAEVRGHRGLRLRWAELQRWPLAAVLPASRRTARL